MGISTRAGDGGMTGLASGRRVPKDDPRIGACGSVDELNSLLGCAAAFTRHEPVRCAIAVIQGWLFRVGAGLSLEGREAKGRLEEADLARLEALAAEIERETPRVRSFLLPGGTPAASFLHVARAVCRRAERDVVAIRRGGDPLAVRFLNRLSDYLFLMARLENRLSGCEEQPWEP